MNRVLTPLHSEELRHNGYTILRGAVAPAQVEAARRLLNWKIGTGLPPEKIGDWGVLSFYPELQNAPQLLACFNESQVLPVLEELMGKGNVPHAGGAQIALRFPDYPGENRRRNAHSPSPHIDGTYCPGNGVPQGELNSFTCLVGVFLSDVMRKDSGNFTVWPGTHTQFAEYFRDHGPEILLGEVHEHQLPPIDLPAPVPVRVQPGDVVIAHHLLAHAAGPNLSPDVRYTLFFRVWHPHHIAEKWEVLSDPWRHWPGVSA